MSCDRCTRPAAVVAIDEPENDGALMFGDPIAGLLLCRPCLTITLQDGPWSRVETLEAA